MQRLVAVKCLHAHLLSDKSSILRFQQEAQAAGNLNHRHIVKIHQYGLDQNQVPFFVMDYLEGQSLQELLDPGEQVEVDRALAILAQAAGGLAHAHKNGVVHRDFKPSNIMLVDTEEAKNCVKIVDFGIAKVMAAAGVARHNLTRTGEVIGSPMYMSPEQCMMLDLDQRTDIYAFGCTMFAALTGREPFVSSSLVEVLYKHINDLPQSISSRRPGIKNAAQLDAVILKCMAKAPADRYQTMAEVSAALEEIRTGSQQNVTDSLKTIIELGKRKGKATTSKNASLFSNKAVLTVAAVVSVGLMAVAGWFAYSIGQSSIVDHPEEVVTDWVPVQVVSPSKESSLRRIYNFRRAFLRCVNDTERPVSLYWLDIFSRRRLAVQIAAHGVKTIKTFVDEPLVVADDSGKALGIFIAPAKNGLTKVSNAGSWRERSLGKVEGR